jgi:hypothetical protein
MEKDTAKIGVTIPAWLLERKIICYYLIIRDCCWNNREFADVLQKAPEKPLYEMISKHMSAFMQQGTMPPAEIAPAIMNLIDDQSSGRTMTMRAGDYISLQNYLRKSK